MPEELQLRIANLRRELTEANGLERAELLDRLEQCVLSLEALGHPAPRWAKERLDARVDAEVEEMFDNMPV